MQGQNYQFRLEVVLSEVGNYHYRIFVYYAMYQMGVYMLWFSQHVNIVFHRCWKLFIRYKSATQDEYHSAYSLIHNNYELQEWQAGAMGYGANAYYHNCVCYTTYISHYD